MHKSVTYVPNSESRSTMFKWIIAILAILLVGATALATYVIYVYSRHRTPVCTSRECLQTAASLKSSMDLSIDVCDNFYEHVCGKWGEHNIGHDGEELTNFVRMKDRVEHIIHRFVKQPGGGGDAKPVKMVRDFYGACMDTETRNNRGLEVMFKYLEQAGLPKVPSVFTLPPTEWRNYKFDWVKASVLLKKVFGLDLFLQFNYEESMLDQSEYVMFLLASISPPSLPQILDEEKIENFESYNMLEDVKRDFKPVVRHIISEVLINETIRPKVLKKASDVIWNMTFQIPTAAKTVGGGKQYDNRMNELRKMTYADLQNLTDTLVAQNGQRPLTELGSWRRYAELLFSEIGNATLGSEEFYYFESELPYILATPLYILNVSDVMIELYAWWRAIFLMIGSTTEEIASTVSDAMNLSWDESDCASLTVEHLNAAIGFGVVPDRFIAETKPEVTEFFESLKEAFVERIQMLEWIDETTRDAALKKIHAMGYVIGAPDWIVNETAILDHYNYIEIRNDTHLDNFMQIIQSGIKDLYGPIQNDDKVGGAYVSVTDVNAYYKPLRNVMIVPWAILNSPAYHLGLRALDYGALGTIIGHEITHGFDGTGRQYDHKANYRLWWTEESLNKFNNRSTCFVEQYENYTIEMLGVSLPINATRTLNENIADNGGAKIAYQALQKFLGKQGADSILPGFEEFNNEQLFFLSHVYLWCNREGSLAEQFASHMDEHSPNEIRVMGILHNMQEFADTFNCPVGSAMNPDRPRCNMW